MCIISNCVFLKGCDILYKITNLKSYKKQYLIKIKGEKTEKEFKISEELLLEYRLVLGKELNEKTYISFQKALDKDLIYQKVLHFALYKQRSTYDIIEFLKRKNVHPDTFKYYLNKLRISKILDDESYVNNYVLEAFEFKLYGPNKIRYDLERKHIKEELINRAISKIHEEKKLQNIEKLFIKKLQNIKPQPLTKTINSIKAFIIKKGYDYQMVETIINSHMNEIQEKSNELISLEKDLIKALKKYKDNDYKNRDKIMAFLLRKGYSYHTIKAKMGEINYE
ncbi:MAG: hypothetical protein B6I17_01620 [Tenericutes bacterium 4572_104]|nr:MAG: hypothetical protein B6I17_01620 [Tenericutes bacterium 4572_104]